MTAPSKNWTDIADTSIAADKPLSTTLLTQIRDDLAFLKDWLGGAYAANAANPHTHDGVNSAFVASVADNSITTAKIVNANVTQSKLKTANGSISGGTGNYTLPGGLYGFYPQIKTVTAGASDYIALGYSSMPTSYVTNIGFFLNWGPGTGYAQQTYIQSSPPYTIGTQEWGHFLFVLRNSNGDIRAAYQAEDPPWAYNGSIYLPKDDPGRILAVPHPFADYWAKDPAVDGLEIALVDMNAKDGRRWREDNHKIGKDPLEDIGSILKGKGNVRQHTDYGLNDQVKAALRNVAIIQV